MLKPETLRKYGWALTQFQQLQSEHDLLQTSSQCQISALVEKTKKLCSILEICGLKRELIEKVMALPTDYLRIQLFDLQQKGQCLASDADFDALLMVQRQIEMCINADLQTLTIYKGVLNMAKTEACSDFLTLTEAQFPYLTRFFLTLECGEKLNETEVRTYLRKYYYEKN